MNDSVVNHLLASRLAWVRGNPKRCGLGIELLLDVNLFGRRGLMGMRGIV